MSLGQCTVHWRYSPVCSMSNSKLEQIVSNSKLEQINDMRYHLFCTKKTWEIESHQLLSCTDCLYKHTQRSNYQAAIWHPCLLGNLGFVVGYGICLGLLQSQDQGLNLLLLHISPPEEPYKPIDELASRLAPECM